ncbi:hypothetical protein G8O24_41060 [Bradyrhizobium sp. INPA01-394B]|uniref:Restriction system protein Mrr-like N-terminal domain-containing protein n=1 Tax=Bradyrhizobium campsiandrae TaxID=1729892 RepID=A0ABR7UL47_9BRAD|nr:hypothetical protein [Bradyrhizobium campsiandrae]MBC9883679.1 hypothetical protein [Bradyrhizobium campsiandrae]MBC9984648.1 hypothetical protein [Bradyrhizobium campsiandrae]
MSFQLSILKILAGQPDGRGSLEVVKQHLAIFYTSGPEWGARMKRLAELAPNLDLFGQKLVEREQGSWRITGEGRAFLTALEHKASARTKEPPEDDRESAELTPEVVSLPCPPGRSLDHRNRRRKVNRRKIPRRSA